MLAVHCTINILYFVHFHTFLILFLCLCVYAKNSELVLYFSLPTIRRYTLWIVRLVEKLCIHLYILPTDCVQMFCVDIFFCMIPMLHIVYVSRYAGSDNFYINFIFHLLSHLSKWCMCYARVCPIRPVYSCKFWAVWV